jgi:hypothetical protein
LLLRRLIAIVLAGYSAYYAFVAAVLLAGSGDRSLVDLIILGAALGGLGMSAALAFGLPAPRVAEDRGPRRPPGGIGARLASLCMILAGSAFAFVAGEAIVSGAILPLDVGKPRVLFSTNPGQFLFLLTFWGGFGILLLVAAFRRPRR